MPDDKKIVAMLAALNDLERHLKLDEKLGDVIKSIGKGKGKGKGGDKKTKNKKSTGNKAKQKEEKTWKTVPSKDETRSARKWASALTIGLSIIWYGAYTSHLNVAWAKSRRRNCRRQSQPILPTLPPMLLPLLQWWTCISRLSLPCLAQPFRGRTKKNDGASQHAHGHICWHV